MRILIDMQALQTGSAKRGVGRYLRGFIFPFFKLAKGDEVHLLFNFALKENLIDLRREFERHIPSTNIHLFFPFSEKVMDRDKTRVQRKLSVLLREKVINGIDPDVVLIPNFFEETTMSLHGPSSVPVFVIHHDLIPFLNRKGYLREGAYRKWYLERLKEFKLAHTYLTNSEYTKRVLSKTLEIPERRIVNVAAGVDRSLFTETVFCEAKKEKIVKKYVARKGFILTMGHPLDPRKNTARLVQAYARLPSKIRKKFTLLFIGGENHRPEYFQTLINSAGLSDNDVAFTGHIDDRELVNLYRTCDLFVFPSTYEGFGFPVLEAILCGAPVIASGVTSIPEILSDPEALFDPFSVDLISEKMERALVDVDFRARLRNNKDLRSLERFTWENTAETAYTELKKIGAKKRPFTDNIKFQEFTLKTLHNERKIDQDDLKTFSKLLAMSSPKTSPQLLIDVSILIRQDAGTGIQRVVRELSYQLLNNPPPGYNVKLIYRSDNGNVYLYANSFQSQILGRGKKGADSPICAFANDVYLGLDLDCDSVHFAKSFHLEMRELGVKMFYVVYDLLPILHPNFFVKGTVDVFPVWIDFISQNSDGLISISRSVMEELRAKLTSDFVLKKSNCSLGFFHLGADFKRPSAVISEDKKQEVLKVQAGESSGFFLMVGTMEVRKGNAQVLDAFELIWDEGVMVPLVIVGKEGWHVEELIWRIENHPQLNKLLFWYSRCSDTALNTLYKNASALIQASYAEGFGLPLIEAAFHKTPIIARDIPVFREVAGDNAYYFSGFSGQELKEAISDWLKLREEGCCPTSEGMPVLSWSESANQLKEVLISMLK